MEKSLLTLESKSANDLGSIAVAILREAGSRRVFALNGPLGAGKTALIRELAKALHVSDNISSPSFTIMNEYQDDRGNPIYHFDFYRIKSVTELYDLGYEVYFYSGNYCFIEWAEKAEQLLPEDPVTIHISLKPNNSVRTISISL
jgi:tRNA threonylcarbamoyladenosine biosynthesis protein TsaE